MPDERTARQHAGRVQESKRMHLHSVSPRRSHARCVVRAAALVVAALGTSAWSQTPPVAYQIIGQWTGGGGRSKGDGYELRGFIPHPTLGWSRTASVPGGATENLELVCGVGFEIPGASTPPVLRVVGLDGPTLEISWSSSPEFVLESTTELGPAAVWTPVTPPPSGSVLRLRATDTTRYFRLAAPSL